MAGVATLAIPVHEVNAVIHPDPDEGDDSEERKQIELDSRNREHSARPD